MEVRQYHSCIAQPNKWPCHRDDQLIKGHLCFESSQQSAGSPKKKVEFGHILKLWELLDTFRLLWAFLGHFGQFQPIWALWAISTYLGSLGTLGQFRHLWAPLGVLGGMGIFGCNGQFGYFCKFWAPWLLTLMIILDKGWVKMTWQIESDTEELCNPLRCFGTVFKIQCPTSMSNIVGSTT